MVPVTVTTSDALSPSVALPLSDVAPVTPSVPPTDVFPEAAVTENVEAPTAKSPVDVSVPENVETPAAVIVKRSVPSVMIARPSSFAACVAIPILRVVVPPVMVLPPTSQVSVARSLVLPVVITVPETSGKVIVLSAVGSVIANDVSKSLAVAPSKTSGVPPAIVPVMVTMSAVASPRVALPFNEVLLATFRVPPM